MRCVESNIMNGWNNDLWLSCNATHFISKILKKKKTAHYPRFLLLAQSDTLGKHFMEREKLDLR